MKKYIKICMRNKEHNVTVPFEVAQEILESNDQIIMLKKDGVWTGEIINKSEIVATHRDREEEKYQGYNKDQLPEPKTEVIDVDKYKPDFMKFKTPPEKAI
jgi:hypothetical protein